MKNNLQRAESYWLEAGILTGKKTLPPKSGEILVIGSGVAGTSSCYWLEQQGFKNITLIDYQAEKSASFRNCGHVLYGSVESMKGLCSIFGYERAKQIWSYSMEVCHDLRDTLLRERINDTEYRQDGYLVVAIDEVEDQEILESIELLNEMGFESSYREKSDLEALGLKNVFGARFEKGSAQIHPLKFRNALMSICLARGIAYHSDVCVESIEANGLDSVKVICKNEIELNYDAVVIATNAYSPLVSRFFAERQLVEPFRGQIICSKPLKTGFPITYPHSFDHGYEYALQTTDKRLMLGGWRQHSETLEKNTYDLSPNKFIEDGLKEFALEHYNINEELEWEYSWSGIMASSKTGLPFIGPLSSPNIFTVSGFTGHGLSWAHGSAKLLAEIMAGRAQKDIAKEFRAWRPS